MTEGKAAVHADTLFPVGAADDPVVRFRRIEFRIVEISTATVEPGPGHHAIDPGFRLRTIQNRTTRESCRAVFRGNFHAIHVGPGLPDDVDHCKHRVRSIQRRTRAAHHFHTLDAVQILREIVAQCRRGIHVVVEHMTIPQQEDPVVVVRWPAISPHTGVIVVPVVGDIETPDKREKFGNCSDLIPGDVIGTDDRDRSRRFAGQLRVQRRSADLDREQLIERKRGLIAGKFLGT